MPWNHKTLRSAAVNALKAQWLAKLAEWRSGSVSALPCERPGLGPRTRLREIIPANNCTMQGQKNSRGIGAPRVWWSSEWHGRCFVDWWSSGSYVAEVFIRSWLRHPTTVSSMWALPQIVKIQNGTKCNVKRKCPSGSIIIGSMPLLIMRSPPT